MGVIIRSSAVSYPLVNASGDVSVNDNLSVTGTSDLQGNIANSLGTLVLNDNVSITGSLSGTGGIITVASTDVLRLANIVTGSLPAAAAGNEGAIAYDTTTNTVKFSDGATWANVGNASGVTTLAAIGASPNANAGTISGTTLNLEPASASFGGVVTTAAQTFAGAKTFNGGVLSDSVSSATATTISYSSSMVDGASALGHKLNTSSAWSTAGAKLASIQNNSVEKAYVALDGAVGLGKVATASLRAAAAGNEGEIVYDDTTNTVKFSNGSSWANIGGGVTALAAIGASPNANGATISGATLNLEPADATNGGVVTTAAQTLAGLKTLSGVTLTTEATNSISGLKVTGGTNRTTVGTQTYNIASVQPTINNTAGTTTVNVFHCDTTNTSVTGTTTYLLNLYYGGSQKLTLDTSGNMTIVGGGYYYNGTAFWSGAELRPASGASSTLSGYIANGASAVNVITKSINSLTTLGAKLFQIQNGSTAKHFVDKDGGIGIPTHTTSASAVDAPFGTLTIASGNTSGTFVASTTNYFKGCKALGIITNTTTNAGVHLVSAVNDGDKTLTFTLSGDPGASGAEVTWLAIHTTTPGT